MKVTLEDSVDFPVLPDEAIVPAKIIEIEARDPNEFRSWPDISWKFQVLDVPGVEYSSLIGSHLYGQTTQKFNLHPDNKLRLWLQAALNVDLTEPGVEVETDAAVGREVRVLVGSYTGRNGVRNKVAGVLPSKGDSTGIPARVVEDPWAAPAKVSVPDLEDPPF